MSLSRTRETHRDVDFHHTSFYFFYLVCVEHRQFHGVTLTNLLNCDSDCICCTRCGALFEQLNTSPSIHTWYARPFLNTLFWETTRSNFSRRQGQQHKFTVLPLWYINSWALCYHLVWSSLCHLSLPHNHNDSLYWWCYTIVAGCLFVPVHLTPK